MRHRSVTYSSRNTAPALSGVRDAAFNALADPTRRAVLDLLRAGSRPAGDIARAFTVSRPAVSKHLSILRRAHLVEERREGRHRLYQLNPEPLREVDTWLQQYREFWTASLNNLKAFVEAEYAKETAAQAQKKGQKESKKEK
ncbi:MAG TPA: metalloregulator ArsR/SmtB family transcription factor [Terriglobales bacterium]